MYIPHTPADVVEMLDRVGIQELDELFLDIPDEFRFPALDLPGPATEIEIKSIIQKEANRNQGTSSLSSFLGAGAYNHYIPSVVDSLLRRGEFYTAYTPYQPEISQGTLRVIYDYQSLMTALTGMEVSNASHYDGATSAAEAVTLAYNNFRGKRKKVILSPALNPQYRQTIHTYHSGINIEFLGEDSNISDGPGSLIQLIDTDTSLVFVQFPDFFGRIFDLQTISEATHQAGALLAVSVNPTALGIFKPPGDYDADIVTGEGQSLGIPLSFGGPYLGIFTTKMELVRKMAGRLVGETEDSRGQRAFVLTLTAREQHIRREKATSNICTNQGLMALAATIYLTILGKQGLRKVSELCYHKAHYAAEKISNLSGYELWSSQPYFHEFVIKHPLPVSEVNRLLLEKGIIGGFDLSTYFKGMENYSIYAVTEMNSRAEINQLVNTLAEIHHG